MHDVGNSCIHFCAIHCILWCVCVLFNSRIYVCYQAGWSSLMFASRYGHVEVVDKLLQHGARVDLQNEVLFSQSVTPILCLCKNFLSK